MDETIATAIEVAHSVVWASVVTVDTTGRPRARVLHPIWLADGDGVVGLAITRPTPIKRRHLAAHPYVTCAYLAPDHAFAHFDCDAALADDEATRRRAWQAFLDVPPPLGHDFTTIFPDGPLSDAMAVLVMRPYRVRAATAAALARGEAPRLWRADEVSLRRGA
jgi:hypothetical protein